MLVETNGQYFSLFYISGVAQNLVLWKKKTFSLILCESRAALYTPKVEEPSVRLSESWHMRQAQRAVSIDNISFITSAMEDRHHSASKDNNSNFSTLNNSNHSSHINHNHNSNNYHNNNNSNHKTNNDDNRNNNNSNHNTINQTSTTTTTTTNTNTNTNINHNTPINASTDNLHKASDDDSDNIIPWRAQLRKTNSRLSLIGWTDDRMHRCETVLRF